MLHEAGNLAAPIVEGPSPAKASVYATKRLGVGDSCAVTSFVTVQSNDLKTANVVKAYFAAYNTSSETGTDDRPMPNNLAVTAEFCGLGPGVLAVQNARVRRIDTTHANPRGYWRTQQKRVTYPTPIQIAQLEVASQLVDEPLTISVSHGCASVTIQMPTTATAVLDFEF